eukprot:s366_g52.t1
MCGSGPGHVWQWARPCVDPAMRGSGPGHVWQWTRPCVAVDPAMCGGGPGHVWQWTRPCVAVDPAMRGTAPSGRYPKQWDLPVWQKILQRDNVDYIDFVMCAWGLGPPESPNERYVHKTRLVFPQHEPLRRILLRPCPGVGPLHRHVALKGARDGQQVTRCTEAGAYAWDFERNGGRLHDGRARRSENDTFLEDEETIVNEAEPAENGVLENARVSADDETVNNDRGSEENDASVNDSAPESNVASENNNHTEHLPRL